ncbi:MAG: serine/threonine-protein kinase [Sandaracinaceae bacterium]
MSATELEPMSELDPLIGRTVAGRYRIRGVIGEGAMGVVYDALHESLQREVALKVLSPVWASDKAASKRFQQEAQMASQLGHRGTVDVYDLGQLEDGRPFLCMERLVGRDVAELLEERGRLPDQLVATIVREVASALDVVHAKGLVHRDIKPENLFLAQQPDGKTVVKLLDFGIAAFISPEAGASRLTRQGKMVGTPQYMAPEIATRDELPDHRADVYSLATVAFECLTGKLPFDGLNFIAILNCKNIDDAPSLSESTGESHADALEEVLARGLARDPRIRPQKAGDFARELWVALRMSTPFPGDADDVEEERLGRERVGLLSEAAELRFPTEVPTLPPPTTRRLAYSAALLAAVLAVAGMMSVFWAMRDVAADEIASPSRNESVLEAAPSTEDAAAALPAAALVPQADLLAALEPPEPEPEPVSRIVVPAPEPRSSRRRWRRWIDTSAESADAPIPRTEEPAPPLEEPEPEEAPPDPARAGELTREGMRALLQGRLADAQRSFQEATRAAPGHGPAWRGLGLASERLGRRAAASRAYRRYLRLAPGAADAVQARARLEALNE